MYLDVLVKIPDVKGKIIRKKRVMRYISITSMEGNMIRNGSSTSRKEQRLANSRKQMHP